MRKNKQVIAVLCAAFLLSLFGCGKKHVLDGPGMINPASWDSFTVSKSSSYAQHCFWITVEDRNEGLFVTGELLGDDGTAYADEEGILLSKEDADRIYALQPALLPDCRSESSGLPDGITVLDQGSVAIEVFCTDGRTLKKVDENDFSIQVYEIVKPNFVKKYG